MNVAEWRIPRAAGLSWQQLGSLRLTLVLLVVLGIGVTLAVANEQPVTWVVAMPLAGLAVNLAVALLTHEVFRRQSVLTVFHLALITLMVLAALGRLTYLTAQIEVGEGQAFDGVPVRVVHGPWHRNELADLPFVNERFVIDYSPETTIRQTVNEVRWQDAAGHWQRGSITENRPLVWRGYRIYVTGGKGFAPRFAWHGKDGSSTVGSVHLPRFPSDEHAQQVEWTLPDGQTPAWVKVQFDSDPLPKGQAGQLAAPGRQGHSLILRLGTSSDRHELKPGDRLSLAGGELEYLGLPLWMGYVVHYDWTVPWMLGVSVMAVLALGWHFWTKFADRGDWLAAAPVGEVR